MNQVAGLPDPKTMSVQRPRLVVVIQLPPPVHGASVMNQAVVEFLVRRQRFELAVFNISALKDLSSIGRVSAAKLAVTLWRLIAIGATLLIRRPRAVYIALVPTGAAFLRDAVLVTIARLLGIRRIFHLHGKGVAQASRAQGFFSKALYRWVFGGAHVILLAPRLLADVAAASPSLKPYYLANGIPDPGRTRRSGDRHPPVILFLSNMFPSKGPLLLLAALAGLARDGVAFRAVFAGGMPSELPRAQFDGELARLGLGGLVDYVGPAWGERKRALLDNADIFAFPTLSDTPPLVILEAMASGLAIVSTIEGAIPEMIEDGKSGVLVPPGDVPALASALHELLASAETRQRLGDAARSRFEARFTAERFEDRLETVLCEACGLGGGA